MEENKIEKYYKLRNYFDSIVYFFRNKKYQKIVKVSLNRKNNKDKFNIINNFIKNLKDSIIIVLLIFFIEKILIILINNINIKCINMLKQNLIINTEMFSNFLICGIGVAGVFLALYYSNIATIYESEYTNATNVIRKLFENEISQNSSLKKINTYIIQSILILFSIMIGLPVWYIFILYMIIKTIDIIITFITKGNTIYEFSNIYNVLLNRKKELIFHIDSVTEKGYLNNNFNFQNFHGKRAVTILDEMETVNNYILGENKLNKKDSILEFMQSNIGFLKYYLYNKNKILFNSLWFQKKMKHKKWYSADFTEKGIALNTGTELQPNNIIDNDWFEEKILKMNENTIMFFVNNGCWKEITYYILKISDAIPYWIKFGNISILYEHIEKIIFTIKNEIINGNKEKEGLLNLLEIICYVFVHYTLCVREFIEKINLNECDKFIINNYKFHDKKILQINNKIFNNSEFYWIYKGLRNEKKLEKKIITPNWYLKQRVSKLYIFEINQLLNIIEKMYRINLNLGTELLNSGKYTFSEAFIMNENELYNKINLVKETSNPIFEELLTNDIEKDYKLPDIDINKIIEHIEKMHFEKAPKLWEKSCEVWGLKDKDNERDVFGFCYNNLCEYIFQNILNFNYDVFNLHYEKLVEIAILSEIDIHDELKDDKLYTDIAKFKFQMSGLNTMFELSGYAIIVGEILNDYRWKKKIDDVISNIFEKFNEAKKWKEIIGVLVNDFWYIESIDYTNKEIRFRNTIEKSQKLKFKYVGPFGNKIVINTKNLEKMYYSDIDGLSIDVREIFAIACLNKHLDSKDKYKSKKMRIEEWIEINDEKK